MEHSEIIQRRLLQLGAILFLLGLVSGLVTGLMENPRMGLSAHLEGVMNGVFLLAIGAVWQRVLLSPRLASLAFWSLAFGTTVNWLTVQFGAFWGTGSMTPIAAPGREAAPWQETLVTVGLTSLSGAMLLGSALLVYGLCRKSPIE